MKSIQFLLFSIFILGFVAGCKQAGGNFTGSEYMPDMAHQVAYEANNYGPYYFNTWDSASTFTRRQLSNPRTGVAGTIARGYAGISMSVQGQEEEVMDLLKGRADYKSISVPVNGSVPYYYKDTEEERTRASVEIIRNPFPITGEGLARGKELYDINCGICHGEKADGAGYLVREANAAKRDPGGVYPAAPANLLQDTFLKSSNGRFYHAIMYGKNVMGGYSDKLSYEERWQVIHHIRSLQAAAQKMVYSEEKNTFNEVFGMPKALIPVMRHDTIAVDTSHADHSDGGHH